MTRPVEGQEPVYIDNRALDGFVERFREIGCRDADCAECGWCEKFARKAIRLDKTAQAQALAAYRDLFQALEDGGMWRYLPQSNGRGKPAAPGGCQSSAESPQLVPEDAGASTQSATAKAG